MQTFEENSTDKLLNYFSEWLTLRIAVPWILKVKNEIKRKTDFHKKSVCCRGEHTVIERAAASTVDDGVLRVGGHLRGTAMPEERKHPAFLAKDHHVSSLRNHMLSRVRKAYWMTNCNSAAQKVLSHCVTCRMNRAWPSKQKMADLRRERLNANLPSLSNTGLDYFNPFEVMRGKTNLKRYSPIFTCMTSQAIHLEMACSLTRDSCINAIRRFLCRRGTAHKIRQLHQP